MFQISDLPVEVLEILFKYLDGQSLARAEQVCRMWRDIIWNLQKVKNIWNSCCKAEIAETILEELLGFRYVPRFNKSEDCTNVLNPERLVNWKMLYKTWFRGQMISEWPYWTNHLPAFDANPITSIKSSGSWIVTGHRNGSVCSWNGFTGALNNVVSQHLKMITDFVLVDLLHLGPYGSDKYPWNHHHIVSISKDHTIQVSPLLNEDDSIEDKIVIYHHSDTLETVRVFNDCFAVSSMDNTVTVWQMECPKYPDQLLVTTLLYSVIGPPQILRWIGFWGDEIQCLCYDGRLKMYSTATEEWTGSLQPKFFVTGKQRKSGRCGNLFLLEDSRLIITNAFIFRSRIVLLSTVDRELCISIDGEHFHRYHLMNSFQTYVVCAALWGTLFALGTESGTLLVYQLSCIEDLIKLDLSEPTWSKKCSEASIIGVDIVDDGQAPAIVAATTESIFTVTWYPPKENSRHIKEMDITSIFAIES